MNPFRLFTLGACALLLAMPATAMAAKKLGKVAKATKAEKTQRKALRQIANNNDANSNGIIDGTELEAVRRIFEADKTGPLKSLDVNYDGALSDTELAALKPHVKGVKKGGKGGKKKKKNAL